VSAAGSHAAGKQAPPIRVEPHHGAASGDAEAPRGEIQHRSDRRPIRAEGDRRAERAAAPFGGGEGGERRSLRLHRRLAAPAARRSRDGADGGGELGEIGPLDREGRDRLVEPGDPVRIGDAGSGGAVGARTALTLEECVPLIDAWGSAARKVNPDVIVLCHGGPLAEPEDAQYVLDRTEGVVGFFGERRTDLDIAPLEEANAAVVREFAKYPGITSYSSMELPGGHWANMVLHDDPVDTDYWRQSTLHADAVRRLARVHYRTVRIHNARLTTPVRYDPALTILRTKYFDYTSEPEWRAVRKLG
jgi:hypothetical protein